MEKAKLFAKIRGIPLSFISYGFSEKAKLFAKS